jgi:hypothetical protein
MSTQHPGMPPTIGWPFVDDCAHMKPSKTTALKGTEAVDI